MRCMALTLILVILCLGGHVSAETVKVFVLGGQSNMVGQIFGIEALPFELQQQDDIAYYTEGMTIPLQPVEPLPDYPILRWGPEISFGRAASDLQVTPTVALVKHAIGATHLATWMPGAPNQNYETLLAETQRALVDIQNQGKIPELAGIIWMQGESDAIDVEEDALNYKSNLTQWIASFRNDTGVPDLPMVVGRITQADIYQYATEVRNAQVEFANEDPFATWINTDDLPLLDDYHYNAQGHITLGRRFLHAFVDLTSLPGDANLTGNVDVGDLTILASHFGRTEDSSTPSTWIGWQNGDFNGDGVVNVGDLSILAANYEATTSGIPVNSHDIPEPASLSILAMGAVLMITRRK